MSDPTLGDYVREAFNARARLPALGEVPVNWLALMAVGTLGLLNPGFWLLGAGLEVGYLAMMSHNERFRNYVKGKRRVEAIESASKSQQEQELEIAEKLSSEAQERYFRLLQRAQSFDASAADLDDMVQSVANEGLEKLRWIFVTLLRSREQISDQIDSGQRERITAELAETHEKLANLPVEDSRLRGSLESTVQILEKRLSNLDNASKNLDYIDSELRRIEHQSELLIEEAALSKDPKQLSARIDAVTSTFDETQEWMRLSKEVLSEIQDGPRRPPPGLGQKV